MPQAKLNLAVAGSGAMAAYHVRRFRGFEGVEVIACYDRHGDRATRFAEREDIPQAYNSMEELMVKARPDAVAVAVADGEHYSVAREVIEAGAALFIEKPLTATLAEAEELSEVRPWGGGAAREAPTPDSGRRKQSPVVVNFSKVNYPAVFGAVHLLRYGLLGPVRRLHISYLQSWIVSTVWGEWWENPRWLWRISSSHRGGGALRDLGSHLFYLVLLILGDGEVTAARAWQEADRSLAAESGYSCDLNDTFRAEVSVSGGAVAEVEASYARPGNVNNVILEAECEGGRVEVDLEKARGIVRTTRFEHGHQGEGREASRSTGPGGVSATGARGRSAGAGPPPREHHFAKVFSTYAEFVRLMSGDESLPHWIPPASMADGVAVQRMIEAAERWAARSA